MSKTTNERKSEWASFPTSFQQLASGFISPNDIRLHITRTGGDGFPLVAIHGRTGNGLLWARTARLLVPYFGVIMPDLRGHGLSDAPADGYDHTTMADDILGVMDALGIERAVLMGGSMGAALATRIAAEHPNVWKS